VARVYLESSFFSACVSTRLSPKSIGWRASSLEWWHTQRHRHASFVSPEVVRELSAEDFVGRDAALELLRGLALLELTREVEDLADLLVTQKVMPGPSVSGDAIHVATAIVHRMDYLLTWNVQHLANPNKRTHFAVICLRLGAAPPSIVTPDMLQETDDE
jgi:predicted nucleic acid-binding protein